MSSFNGQDYDYLFALAQRLYSTNSRVEQRGIALQIMAMVESVRGQQIGWPQIGPSFRHLTIYPRTEMGNILPLMQREKGK